MERSATILNAFNIEWITTAAVTGFFSIVAFNSWWGLLEWVPLSDVITLISSPSAASWRSFLLFAVNEKPQFNQVTSSNQVGEHSLHHFKENPIWNHFNYQFLQNNSGDGKILQVKRGRWHLWYRWKISWEQVLAY